MSQCHILLSLINLAVTGSVANGPWAPITKLTVLQPKGPNGTSGYPISLSAFALLRTSLRNAKSHRNLWIEQCQSKCNRPSDCKLLHLWKHLHTDFLRNASVSPSKSGTVSFSIHGKGGKGGKGLYTFLAMFPSGHHSADLRSLPPPTAASPMDLVLLWACRVVSRSRAELSEDSYRQLRTQNSASDAAWLHHRSLWNKLPKHSSPWSVSKYVSECVSV